jgi:hypothetical protein
MLGVGYIFLGSAVLFLLSVLIVSFENKKMRRLFLTSVRDRLDTIFLDVNHSIRAKYALVVKYSLKLSWYYSLHAMLRAVMTVLVRSYDTLELVVIKNRARAKKIRTESRLLSQGTSHLTEIEKHKQLTALTTNQKKKLRARKLERE